MNADGESAEVRSLLWAACQHRGLFEPRERWPGPVRRGWGAERGPRMPAGRHRRRRGHTRGACWPGRNPSSGPVARAVKRGPSPPPRTTPAESRRGRSYSGLFGHATSWMALGVRIDSIPAGRTEWPLITGGVAPDMKAEGNGGGRDAVAATFSDRDA